MAEGGRFELPVACATTDFESVTFDHSDTPPKVSIYLQFCAFLLLPQAAKKFAELPATLFTENSFSHLDLVIETLVLGQIINRPNGTDPRVPTAVYQLRYARQDDAPHTHDTGFKRYVKRTIEEAPGTKIIRRLADCDHFCMGCRILRGLSQVMPAADNLIVPNDNSPDGYFGQRFRSTGFHQGLLHKDPILFR